MEMQILLFGIALPVIFGVAFSVWRVTRSREFGFGSFFGVAIASVLFISAISEDSLQNFTTLNRWLWFPCSILICGFITGIGDLFSRSFGARVFISCSSVILGVLFINIPGWENVTSRLLLGVATAVCSTLLFVVVRRRNCFSTIISLCFALIAPSVLAMLSGFAKLAIPIGAASCCLGFVSLVRLATQSNAPLNECVGFSGAVVIACIAALGAATGWSYDTSDIPVAAWLLASIAPLGLWLGELPTIHSRPTLSAWARILGCVILAASSIVITVFVLGSSAPQIVE